LSTSMDTKVTVTRPGGYTLAQDTLE